MTRYSSRYAVAFGDVHLLLLAVDAGDLLAGAHFQAVVIEKAFGSLNKQLIALLYNAADVVGESAVRVAYVVAAFKDDDFSVFVDSPESGGCRCSAGDAANDKYFHSDLLRS